MEFAIAGRKIGPDHPPLVIAEVGINHEGSFDKAIAMVDAAVGAGAEVVKFQCHIVEKEMVPTDMTPGEISTEKLWDIIKRCELTEDEERRVQKYCAQKGTIYLSTPFSREAADRLRHFAARGYVCFSVDYRLTGELPDPARGGLMMKTIAGGWLAQSRDNGRITRADLKVVTDRAPTEEELDDALFAWTIAKHVKSNAIVYAKGGSTAGIGAGQMNRRDSARIAAVKAREAAESHGWAQPRTVGSAVASDAFFPFADGLLAAVEAGATCVIQPGGSIRDDEVIAAANEAGLAMVFTGMRHFRH